MKQTNQLAPLPRSRARSMYDLMEDVNKIILEEPQRLYMVEYISKFQDPSAPPACGTVACYAGWAAILLSKERGLDKDAAASRAVRVENELAPKNSDLRYELVSAFVQTSVRDQRGKRLENGTPEYAQAVVERFKAIMTEHETELKATPVVK